MMTWVVNPHGQEEHMSTTRANKFTVDPCSLDLYTSELTTDRSGCNQPLL